MLQLLVKYLKSLLPTQSTRENVSELSFEKIYKAPLGLVSQRCLVHLLKTQL